MAKLRNKLSYLLALVAPTFSLTTYADDEPPSSLYLNVSLTLAAKSAQAFSVAGGPKL